MRHLPLGVAVCAASSGSACWLAALLRAIDEIGWSISEGAKEENESRMTARPIEKIVNSAKVPGALRILTGASSAELSKP